MLVKLFDIDTLVKLTQFLNAFIPILFTLSGIVTLIKFEKSQNTLAPILVTLNLKPS